MPRGERTAQERLNPAERLIDLACLLCPRKVFQRPTNPSGQRRIDHGPLRSPIASRNANDTHRPARATTRSIATGTSSTSVIGKP